MRSEVESASAQYLESIYHVDDPGLSAICDRLIADKRWGINIGPNEARILQFLVRLSRAKNVIEIGTLYGYSGVWLARALPDAGRLITIEKDAKAAQLARVAFQECGVAEKVELLEGDAIEVLAGLNQNMSFDFVFIDANKSAYPSYLDWAEINIKPGGLIVADNVFLGGAVFDDKKPNTVSDRQWVGMREFNKRLADKSKFASVVLPTGEGLSVSIRL